LCAVCILMCCMLYNSVLCITLSCLSVLSVVTSLFLYFWTLTVSMDLLSAINVCVHVCMWLCVTTLISVSRYSRSQKFIETAHHCRLSANGLRYWPRRQPAVRSSLHSGRPVVAEQQTWPQTCYVRPEQGKYVGVCAVFFLQILQLDYQIYWMMRMSIRRINAYLRVGCVHTHVCR